MNLMMLLEMAAEGLGDRIAVGSREGGITYGELFARAGAAATRFREDPGDAVVLCDESSPAVPISLFGAAWAGKPYIPLNYRLPDTDLCALAARSAPGIAVADAAGATRLDRVDGLTTVVRDAFLAEPGDEPGHAIGDWNMDAEERSPSSSTRAGRPAPPRRPCCATATSSPTSSAPSSSGGPPRTRPPS